VSGLGVCDRDNCEVDAVGATYDTSVTFVEAVVDERLCGVHIEPRLQEWRDSHGYEG
jgi:hypothetical protein